MSTVTALPQPLAAEVRAVATGPTVTLKAGDGTPVAVLDAAAYRDLLWSMLECWPAERIAAADRQEEGATILAFPTPSERSAS